MLTKTYSKIDFNCMGVLSCCFLKHSELPAMKFEGLNVCDVNGIWATTLSLRPRSGDFCFYVWESEGGVAGF